MQIRRATALAVAVGAAFSPAAMAQWLSFSDETGQRLQLNSSHFPTNDDKEKDMVAADLNKDGWTDIVVGRKTPFSNPGAFPALLLINENGVLQDRTQQFAPGLISTPMDTRDVVIADFDGDTWLDVVFSNISGQAPKFYRNRQNPGGQWLGLADESSRFGPVSTPSITSPCALWQGDIENDGDLDIYFCSYNGDTDFIMVNDGTGNFTDQTAQRLGNYANSGFGTATEFRDFDLDGDEDIMKVSTLFGEPPFPGIGVFILWNNGQGVFNASQFHEIEPTASPYSCSVGKLDPGPTWDVYIVQDGQDQVKKSTVNGTNNISWTNYAGSGAGYQFPLSSPRTSGLGGSNHFADVDNDGDLDHGVGPIDIDIPNCGGTGGSFALLRNDGTGKLADPYTSNQNFNVQPHDFAFLDINKDGCLDIFMGLCQGWKVFIRQGCPPPVCYPDCNGVGGLTIADFGCFQTKFVAGDPYADCNGVGGLTIADFGCFQTRFVQGCP